MKLLKIGISGVRGIVGESMTPKLAMDFAAAFGTFVGRHPVLLGRDTRVSSPMLRAASLAALASTGCDVYDQGVCPTPILQFLVRHSRRRPLVKGGISITAGHNDIDWNALTFIGPDGTYLNAFQGQEVLDIYHLGKFRKVPGDRLGTIRPGPEATDRYFAALTRFLKTGEIRKAHFKVVLDAVAGAGAPFLAPFAEALGFELVPVNDQPNGFFPHDPEPRPRNAQQVVSVIKAIGADAGFLLNSDASRVSIVTETGEPLSEEYTFPLLADDYLRTRCGPVVTNFSTSRMIEDVTRDRRCPLVRTKVGQSHAIQTLLQEGGVLAGEGSGGVAIAAFQPAFDGFLTMGYILEIVARTGKPLSRLAEELPRYHIVKEKLYCPSTRIHSVVSEVKRHFRRHEIDTSDGVRVEDKTGWVQVRTSATEPMIRVIAEDRSKEKARERADDVIRFIQPLVQ
jgi:phosphomannomutase